MNLPYFVRWATGIRWQWKVFIPVITVLGLSIAAIFAVLRSREIQDAQWILIAAVFFAILLCFVLLAVLLALSPTGRRLLVPAGLLIALAIWLLGSIHFQSQSPLVRRATSLAPTSLTANVEDRYRLDERANVLGSIGEHPITGLGIAVPWRAAFRGLSTEHAEGREYVHFAALWYWLKLGILGLIAYVTLLIGVALLAWRVWRRSREPAARVFGLASLCGIAGLAVIETTASFTGVDVRFTVLFGAQVGLLALLAMRAEADPADEVIGPDGA